MAQILPMATSLTIQEDLKESSKHYLACIHSSPEYLQNLEDSLMLAISHLEDETKEYNLTEALLQELSNYQQHKEKTKQDLGVEIEQLFYLLPTEAFLFSFEEAQGIVDSLYIAMSKASDEEFEIIKPIFNGFSGFLSEWINKKQKAGSDSEVLK